MLALAKLLIIIPIIVIKCQSPEAPDWLEHCKMLLPALQERCKSAVKDLDSNKVQVALMTEKNSGLEQRSELAKTYFESSIEMLKMKEALRFVKAKEEKKLQQEKCNLRLQLAEVGATNNHKDCEEKLKKCVDELKNDNQQRDIKLQTINLSTGTYFISSDAEKMNWHLAFKTCKSHGLELVSLETHQENNLLAEAIKTFESDFWISATNLGSADGRFYWASTGQFLGSDNETSWSHGQPDNYQGGESCVYMLPTSQTKEIFKWKYIPCDRKLRFICELRPNKQAKNGTIIVHRKG